MISDEERREVAERLRGVEVCSEWDDYDGARLCDAGEVALALGLVYDDDSAWITAESVEHLADIVDRPTTTRTAKSRTKYGRKVPMCERCGYSIGDERQNYCPKCGAEIIE